MSSTKRIAIVGARSRLDRQTVIDLVDSLPAGSTVVSGGCRGVDTWAAEAAADRGLAVEVFGPDLAAVESRHQAALAHFRRNQFIAERCDELIALLDGMHGGTWTWCGGPSGPGRE